MRVIFSLIILCAALTACNRKANKVTPGGELLLHKVIEYPSGSALAIRNERIYIMGDDANGVLILDTNFNKIDSIPVFNRENGRIDKPTKPDIESMDLIGDELWLLSSGTVSPYRDSLFKVNLNTNQVTRTNLSFLFGRLESRLRKVNIEALTSVKDELVLGNRKSRTNKGNVLIMLPSGFHQNQLGSPLKVMPVLAPAPDAALSGMSHYPKKNLMFFTFSEEDTPDSYEDGDIGQSYLGVLRNAKRELKGDSIRSIAWLPLSNLSSSFNRIKVESIAVAPGSSGTLTLYLVADNDDGRTALFKVRLDSY